MLGGRWAWGRRIAPRAHIRSAPLPILAAALSLSACSAPSSYMGVSLTPGAAEPHIQSLARHAQAGDKHAQLALGIAYEEGKGVAADLKRAHKLYRAAATASGGTIYVYIPATRKGGKGGVMPVNTGPRVEGLAEARERLERKVAQELIYSRRGQ